MRKLNQTSFVGSQIIFSSLDTVDILGDKEYASTPGFEGGSFSAQDYLLITTLQMISYR